MYKKITTLATLLYVVLVTITIITITQGMSSQKVPSYAYELGHFMSKASLILLVTVLIPGITKRLQKGISFSRHIMPYRRHIGILMFLTAYAHAWMSNLLLRAINGTLMASQPPFILFGSLALTLTFPLFLTSNNFSVRKLGRNWAKLHKLVYGVLLAVLLHTALQKSVFAIIAGVTFVAEITSFIVQAQRKKSITGQTPGQ